MKSPRLRSAFGILLVLPAVFSSAVKADEFSVVPAGDPIYGNLAAVSRLAPPSKTPGRATPSFTRYEAALQTARVLLSLSVKESNGGAVLSKENARSLRDLITALRPELRQLDTDPDESVAMLDRLANRPVAPRVASIPPADRLLNKGTERSSAPVPARVTAPLSLGAATSPEHRASREPDVLDFALSRRVRATAALLAMQRETEDPFGDAAREAGFLRPAGPVSRLAGTSAASLSYGFNSWLRVRAGGEHRTLNNIASGSMLSAPMFNGSRNATASGGGLDASFGNLRFSTDVTKLAGSNGNGATAVGGGLGLSAWQNRLSLSAHMAHLEPDDRAALDATATELNIGLDVTRRLSLNMLYQGLFTEQRATSSSRVAGGLTLNF